jgi:molecular chaperone GrpE
MSQDKNQENQKDINKPTDSPSAEEAMVGESTTSEHLPSSPEEMLVILQAQLQEHQDQFLRAKAEVENARRRSIEEVAKAHKFAIEGFAESLLPVLDSLTAVLSDSGEDSTKMKEGIELTLKQLMSALEKGRVQEINPVGEKFDPHRHQAIAMVPHEQEANTVVTVLQKGYLIADRILRPALVTVSQPK